MYQLDKEEQSALKGIVTTRYMQKTIELVEQFVHTHTGSPKTGYQKAFDELFRILNEAKSSVDEYLAERKANNEIKDEKQALKSIAGNSFSQVIIYLFLKNKELETIRPDIFITSHTSQVPWFDEIASITVGEDTQKPDCDLIFYSLNADRSPKKCMILSLKTSRREQAEQTYKWKLLMEIAASCKTLKEKYHISYTPKTPPLICFATANFYNEINNPQQRGMLKFFDKAFIADTIESHFIAKMSELPDYVNEHL